MAAKRSPRLSRRRVEQLLDGRAADGELARLLALAGRPGDPEQPAPGEREALLAFASSSDRLETTHPRSSSVPTPALRRLLVAKVLAVAAAVATVGGVAVAATTSAQGHLVNLVASSRPAVAPTSVHAAVPASPSHRADDDRRPGSSTPAASDPARVSEVAAHARLATACIVWAHWSGVPAHATPARGQMNGHYALPPTALPAEVAALVKAAGGSAKVSAYCVQLADRICSQWSRMAPGVKLPAGTPAVVARAECPLREALAAGSKAASHHGNRPVVRPTGQPTGQPTGRASGVPIRR